MNIDELLVSFGVNTASLRAEKHSMAAADRVVVDHIMSAAVVVIEVTEAGGDPRPHEMVLKRLLRLRQDIAEG